MQLELATVISCDPHGCRVTPVAGGQTYETHYSALVQDRVKIRPGQLVAVDLDPAVPEVAWRWYKAHIIETGEQQIVVKERDRYLTVVNAPQMELAAEVSDLIWVTGMQGTWELHDRVVDGKPSDPAQLQEKVLPRIETLLLSS
jgi:hypothetical protein